MCGLRTLPSRGGERDVPPRCHGRCADRQGPLRAHECSLPSAPLTALRIRGVSGRSRSRPTEETEMADRDETMRRLEDGVRALTESGEWQRWLDVQRRFHSYSFNNVLLIALQRPDATRVAGFRRWLEMGRHVRKGEKGIAIIAPIVHRTKVVEDDGTERTVSHSPERFRIAHVFDVAQTDGDELPESPARRLSGDDATGAYTRLVEVAHSIGYTVEEDYLSGGTNGLCDFVAHCIRVEVTNDPVQQVKTLAHELAHAMLHDPAGFSGERGLAELEAESVAYVVCDGVGVDSGSYSFGYVAGWAGGGDEALSALKASGARIARTARTILDAVTEVDTVEAAA
jgi:antirestriction protein ArdC